MAKDTENRENIKDWKKSQSETFLANLPFPEEVFRQLFDYLDEIFETTSCNHDFRLTTKFLKSKKIDFNEHIDFFIEHGGGCDCEILMNVEEAFPEKTKSIPTKPQTEKKESFRQLNLLDFKIENIPSPWKLFKIGEKYEFQFGKNSNIKVMLTPSLDNFDWENKEFLKKKWEMITKLKVKSEYEVTYDKINQYELVTFKTKDWTPVLTWIKPISRKLWGLVFRTELSRLRGDMNELKNLLKNIND